MLNDLQTFKKGSKLIGEALKKSFYAQTRSTIGI